MTLRDKNRRSRDMEDRIGSDGDGIFISEDGTSENGTFEDETKRDGRDGRGGRGGIYPAPELEI